MIPTTAVHRWISLRKRSVRVGTPKLAPECSCARVLEGQQLTADVAALRQASQSAPR